MDSESNNLDKEPVNVDIENTFEGETYYFSTAQDPTSQHYVYGSPREFSVAMMKYNDPTLLTYEDTYTNIEINPS